MTITNRDAAVTAAVPPTSRRGVRLFAQSRGDFMTSSLRRRVILIATAVMFAAPVAYAVSLFDVIQLSKKGYREQQIIAIIETTDSRFQVDADTVVTLKQEGVSEKVIQAILARNDGPPPRSEDAARERPQRETPPPRGDERWRTEGAREPADHGHDEDVQEDAVSEPAERPVAPSHASATFSYFPFEETGAGHHQHVALALGDVPMIVLRSEAGYDSIAARAHDAADALNRVQREGLALSAAGDSVTARTTSGERITIVKVTRGDVVSLQRRSVGAMTPQRIAAYWTTLLADYVDVASGRPPSHLTASGIDSIQSLYREIAGGSGEDSLSLAAAVDRLPADERQALIDLAAQVPARFRTQEDRP